MASILRQLLTEVEGCPSEIHEFYQEYSEFGVEPPLPLISKTLASFVNQQAKAFLVLDALGELNPMVRRDLLHKIYDLCKNKSLLILTTSRVDFLSNSTFPSAVFVKIQPSGQDMKHYIERSLSHDILPESNLRRRAVKHMLEAANGIFLIPKIQIHLINSCEGPRAMKLTIDSLAKEAGNLDTTYEDAMKRISARNCGGQLLNFVENRIVLSAVVTAAGVASINRNHALLNC